MCFSLSAKSWNRPVHKPAAHNIIHSKKNKKSNFIASSHFPTFVFNTDLNAVAAMVEIRVTGGRPGAALPPTVGAAAPHPRPALLIIFKQAPNEVPTFA